MKNEKSIDWSAWFEDRVDGDLRAYMRGRWIYNEPIWRVIQATFPKGARILEAGSGTGTYSISLSLMGYDVTGIDIDPAMVKLSNGIAKDLGADNVRFKEGSIFDLEEEYGKYDLVYSVGVLEHFEDHEVVDTLEKQARCAPHVLSVVPSILVWEREHEAFDGKFFPYRIGRLRKRVKESGMKVEQEFGFSTGTKLGRAAEVLLPPIVQPYVIKHVSATLGILSKSKTFTN